MQERPKVPMLAAVTETVMASLRRFGLHAAAAVGWIGGSVLILGSCPAASLPPADDIPEEVLRNQVVLDGRSAIDNSELSPTEYAELQALLEDSQEVTPRVSPELQRLILLLKLRKILRSVTPLRF